MNIETDIPIPPPRKGRGRWQLLAERMRVGQSVVVEDADQARALRNAMKSLNMTGSRRVLDGGAIRVWRVS